MPDEAFRRELLMLMRRGLFLSIAAYLISVPVIGATLRFALGLAVGHLVLLGTLILLNCGISRMAYDAKHSGVTSQRRYLLLYALRLLLFAAGFGAALLLRGYIHPVAVCIPMLYPRIIYTAGALFQKSGPSGAKKR
jgi:hypothetical protein